MPLPFFNAYGLTTLQLDFSLLALTGIVTGAVALFFSPLVGWLMDRYGYRVVVTVCVRGRFHYRWVGYSQHLTTFYRSG
ncbi:MAG: hypothetical protein ACUVUA_01690 [Chloroflexus sp.]